jgi:hypothetical protein
MTGRVAASSLTLRSRDGAAETSGCGQPHRFAQGGTLRRDGLGASFSLGVAVWGPQAATLARCRGEHPHELSGDDPIRAVASTLGNEAQTPAADEPQSSRRTLTSRLLRPVDASVRRPRDLALGLRPQRA